MSPSPEPLVLLPPSEGKAEGGTGTWSPAAGAFPGLEPPRRAVVRAVGRLLKEGDDLTRVTDTRGALAERALRSWRQVVAGKAPALPAWQRFTGVVWEHLAPAGLTARQRDRIIVVCGLPGLALGGDPVPDFRLKMGVSLPGVGRVDRLWEPLLAPAIRAHAGTRAVINLLPAEHARAVGPLDGEIRVSFLTRGRSAAGHGAKAVKGTLARALLTSGLGAVASFEWEGWRAAWRDEDHVEVIGG